MQVLAQIHHHETLICNPSGRSSSAVVYLHGRGGFGKGATGQFEFEDFPTLFARREITIPKRFLVACAMTGDRYNITNLSAYLDHIQNFFALETLHLVGYSRGSEGVSELLQCGYSLTTATVINSRLSPAQFGNTQTPLHIIYSLDDGRNHPDLKTRPPKGITLTAMQGDHYNIAEIARSSVVIQWINAQTGRSHKEFP